MCVIKMTHLQSVFASENFQNYFFLIETLNVKKLTKSTRETTLIEVSLFEYRGQKIERLKSHSHLPKKLF